MALLIIYHYQGKHFNVSEDIQAILKMNIIFQS